VILGLTGSIGMGKSTAARMFRRCGVPVHDADAAVHKLIGPDGEAVAAIEAAFPDVITNGQVDRQALARIVYQNPQALSRLEGLLHPFVRCTERRFLRSMARARYRVVVLDIPLLFETGAERGVDLVIVVTAPFLLQRQRVLRRPGMTPEKFAAILHRQISDQEKRRRADVVLQSGLGRRRTLDQIRRLLRGVGVDEPQGRRGVIRTRGLDYARNCS